MNDDEVLVAITKMDSNLEAMIDRIDFMRSDIQDHEMRIRVIEHSQNRMLGKLTAVWVGVSGGVAAVVSWVTTTWH